MNIPDILNKIKTRGFVGNSKVIYYTILTLSCTASFYLGYIAKEAQGETIPQVVIECPLSAYKQPNQQVSGQNMPIGDPADQGGSYRFIASKNGKNYYPKDCKSASRIKADNIVGFSSTTEAENAGYSLSKLCN